MSQKARDCWFLVCTHRVDVKTGLSHLSPHLFSQPPVLGRANCNSNWADLILNLTQSVAAKGGDNPGTPWFSEHVAPFGSLALSPRVYNRAFKGTRLPSSQHLL